MCRTRSQIENVIMLRVSSVSEISNFIYFFFLLADVVKLKCFATSNLRRVDACLHIVRYSVPYASKSSRL